jgi:plasmid stabilization system protein ParE
MNVRFTLEALTHIATIHSYIEGRSPVAAAHVVQRIFADVDRLAEFPHIGHVGAVPGTYEWTVRGLPTSSSTRLTMKRTTLLCSESSTVDKIAEPPWRF